MNNRLTAIIPIKYNSQRVPGKNFRSFSGKPLFYWIIKTLYSCYCVSDVVVNADSEEVETRVREFFPAIKVIRRPQYLCGDDVSVNLILEETLEQTAGEFFIQTHVTNPCLKSSTIDAACSLFLSDNGVHDSCFSVTKHYSRFYDAQFQPINHNPDVLVQTQDLPPIYEDNSCFYIFSREGFKQTERRIGRNPLLFPVARIESSDIDTEEDFLMAELFFKHQQGGELSRG